jgi:hypothetical protein
MCVGQDFQGRFKLLWKFNHHGWWLDKTTLEQKTKNDYKNGRRLILQSALCGCADGPNYVG